MKKNSLDTREIHLDMEIYSKEAIRDFSSS